MSATISQASNNEARLLGLAVRLDTYRERYDAQHDSRAVFTYAYAHITRVLAASVFNNVYQNPDWVVQLAESFALFYFRALDAEDRKETVPAAWQGVFKAIRFNRTSVLEDLVFAMTAHIVHDLPYALIDVGLGNEHETSRINDFHRINDVLAGNVTALEDILLKRYAPLLRFLDHLEKGYDQILSNYGFRLSRGMAWYNACRLLNVASRADVDASITRSTITLIDNVRNPPWRPLRLLFRGARLLVGFFRVWPRN
jgi:hypothetical protein